MSKDVRYKAGLITIIALGAELWFWIVAAIAWFNVPIYFEQFRFEKPKMLWGLLLLPIFVIFHIFTIRRKNRNLSRYGDSHLLEHIVPDISSFKTTLRFLLTRFGLACVVIALAGPQMGTKLAEVKTKGIDVMIAVDVSNSMLAQDLDPNRMEVAKRSIQQLLNKLKSDRVGIVVFAGEAYTQLPMTNDYVAARIFLGNLDPGIIGAQGTAIGAAIDQCMRGFNMKNGSSKSIVILTDGENHEDDAESAARAAQEKGVTVHTLGMGSAQGAPIPIMRGKQVVGFKKDKKGNTVVSKLDDRMLKSVATAGGGVFIRASTSRAAIDPLMDQLRGMEQSEAGTFQYAGYEDRFQWFLGVACVFLFFALLINETRSRWWNRKVQLS